MDLPSLRNWPGLLVCALVLIVLAGCGSQPTETPIGQRPLRVLSAQDHIEEAWRMARQWRDDAELKRVKASVIAPRQFGALYVDFHFESPSEDQLRYEITCSARSCFPRELAFPRTDYEPIEFDEEMIDSIEAATIGHQNGGKPFASVRRGTMRVSLQWDASHDVGSTVWMAYYSDLVGALYIFIDPYTGEVIRIED